MDIQVLNDKNKACRPWLTVIIDDCSRAICGYELSFLNPSEQSRFQVIIEEGGLAEKLKTSFLPLFSLNEMAIIFIFKNYT